MEEKLRHETAQLPDIASRVTLGGGASEEWAPHDSDPIEGNGRQPTYSCCSISLCKMCATKPRT